MPFYENGESFPTKPEEWLRLAEDSFNRCNSYMDLFKVLDKDIIGDVQQTKYSMDPQHDTHGRLQPNPAITELINQHVLPLLWSCGTDLVEFHGLLKISAAKVNTGNDLKSIIREQLCANVTNLKELLRTMRDLTIKYGEKRLDDGRWLAKSPEVWPCLKYIFKTSDSDYLHELKLRCQMVCYGIIEQAECWKLNYDQLSNNNFLEL